MNLNKYALVCYPADTVAQGLCMTRRGEVDVALAKEQHRGYLAALKELGYSLVAMPADDTHPDSVFVEDPAVIVRDALITTRLRRPERQGEEINVRRALSPYFARTFSVGSGFVEGGDVLVTDTRLYIGLSARTDAEGAEALGRIVKDALGMPTTMFRIPKTYLHMKGEATFHRNPRGNGEGLITVSEEIARHFADSGYALIETPPEERFGANCISGGGRIFIHAGRPKTRERLERAGFAVEELAMSEFEKIDGALTCLSKLFLMSA